MLNISFLKKIKSKGILGLIKSLNYRIMVLLSPLIMKVIPYIFCKKNRVIFESFLGKGYQNEPRLVCEKLRSYCKENNIQVEIVWIIKEESIIKSDIPDDIIVKKQGTWEEIIALATSSIWVDNYRKLVHIRKTKKQKYFQMWHSNGPILKCVEKDALDKLPRGYKKRAINDSKMADRFYAECEWRKNNFINSFWYNGIIEECSTPYAEFTNNKEINTSIREKYGLKNQKIALYAPTFRNDENYNYMSLDSQKIVEKLKKKFGGDWVFCVRLHPGLNLHSFNIPDSVINMTDYPSFDKLLSISDIFITDYSGTLLKALKNKTITFIYANDFDEYLKKDRGLYFDLKKLPAAFSTTSDNLIHDIENFKYDLYINKLNAFLDKMGYYPSTNKNVVDSVTDDIIQCLKKGK